MITRLWLPYWGLSERAVKAKPIPIPEMKE